MLAIPNRPLRIEYRWLLNQYRGLRVSRDKAAGSSEVTASKLLGTGSNVVTYWDSGRIAHRWGASMVGRTLPE